MKLHRALTLLIILVVPAVAALGGVVPALAAGPYTVNSTLDEPDAAPGSGGCSSTPSGVCTLRAAIMEANFNFTPDTIILPASAQAYQITRNGFDDTGVNGDLDVTTPITLTGGGAAGTFIDGGNLDRVIHIQNAVTVNISGVTIRNGHANTPGGGGIYVSNPAATLNLSDSVVTSNEAQMGDGAGIYSGGNLTVNNSVISDNQGLVIDVRGGGLYLAGAATINNSLITGNSDNGSAGGGGIYSVGDVTVNFSTISGNTGGSAYAAGGIHHGYGTLTVNNSTVSGNQAISQYGYAGGIVNLQGTVYLNNSTVSDNQAPHQFTQGAGGLYTINDQGGSTVLTNSTVSGNSTKNYGGGIYVPDGGVVYLLNATVTNNRADSDDSDDLFPGAHGGGIVGVGAVHVRNSLIAGNLRGVVGDEDPDDCSGTLLAEDYNLIGNTFGCTIQNDNVTNLKNVAANLGPLAFNGGATLTHLPLAGSPAIDAASPAGCQDVNTQFLLSDQRGMGRTLDGDGVPGARCDIGAVEVSNYAIFVPVVVR